MEDAIYGGRIEQQLDIGILRAYLHQYMCREMVGDVGSELRPGLKLPRFNRLADCIHFVNSSISESDSPSTFGLPENLLTTWEIAQSQRTVGKLRESERDNFGAKDNSDFVFGEWSNQLNPILAFWKKLNQSSDLLQSNVAEVRGSEDPLLEMLSTELYFAVGLVSRYAMFT
jgi:dynein heavy chain 2